ncbi:sulfotransferase family 2 domain-containing protein [Poseidonocella sp. HB161398]|uniref:sulfotransferase family 2 domain-containing protein n=1 Tax=Poseidonocella sp. HB161398 TaxID=2320855 RepID=UPI001109584F|nr:sulfotransferase family 2 domain-containing protein [Poseidonocella sp. HB161398]
MAQTEDSMAAGAQDERYKGLFFLHIPKTAGSFVAQLFAERMGQEACIAFQEREVQHAVSKGGPLSFLGRGFVSAHSPMASLRRAGVHRHYEIFTVLRDPVDRLVSHLNWMDRFNHGIDLHSFAALKPGMKELVRTLARYDPDSAADMRQLFLLDGLAKARMFYNIQATMLFAPRSGDILAYVDLERLTPVQVQRRLAGLAFCATLEQFKTGLGAAGIAIPEEARVNGGKTRRFRRTPQLEAACRRYVALDQRLYDLIAAGQPEFAPLLQRLLPPPAPGLRLAAGA